MKNPISDNSMSAFTTPREHGAREWRAFNPIRDDKTDTFPTAEPKKSNGPRKPGIIEIITKPNRFHPRPAN